MRPLHDNAPIHTSGLSKVILDYGFQQKDHPLHSADMTPRDLVILKIPPIKNTDYKLQGAVLAHFKDKTKDYFLKELSY